MNGNKKNCQGFLDDFFLLWYNKISMRNCSLTDFGRALCILIEFSVYFICTD